MTRLTLENLLDYSVYPDLEELPTRLDTLADKADYLARICGAWDFGMVPTPETFILFADWREVFDKFPLLHYPAYAAFRSWLGWPPVPGGSVLEANYEHFDDQEDREDSSYAFTTDSLLQLPQLMHNLLPQCPANLHSITTAILNEMVNRYPDQSRYLVLGGYFALKCYLDYRDTHDIDAWWSQQSALQERELTLDCLRLIMQEVGEAHHLSLAERTTNTMVSLELRNNNQTIFSVQVAERDVELEPPIPSPWTPIQIETLRDNLASKMTALVKRGAPRDFRDVQAVVNSGVATVAELWEIWQLKNPKRDVNNAKLEALHHLESISLRRPLEQLPTEQQVATAQARQWLRETLLGCCPN